MRSLGLGILSVVALVAALGLFMLGAGLRNVYRAIASKAWPTVSGVVTESDSTSSVTRESQRGTVMYSAYIEVRYHVGTQDYTTATRHFGQLEGSGDPTDAALERYRFPVGEAVPVSYNQSNPAIATVQPGVTLSALVLPFAGAAFLAMTLMMIAMLRDGGAIGAVMIIFSLIFCGIGVALLTPGVSNLWHGKQSVSWPTTSALIVYGTPANNGTSVSAEADSGTTAPASDALQVSSASHRLIYRYDVNGHRHFNRVRAFGQLAGSSDTEWSDAIAERYALGRHVTVAYSPGDADLSVLEPGISREALYLPGAGLAFLLFGLAVLFIAVPAISK